MLFLASKSERVKLSILGLGGAIPELRHFLLIRFPFTTIFFQLMLPRVQIETDAFLRTRLLHAISSVHKLWLVQPSGCARSHIAIVASAKCQNMLYLPRTNSWELSVTSPWRLAALQEYNPWSDRETFAINSNPSCRWWLEDSLTFFLNQVTFASGTPRKTLANCNTSKNQKAKNNCKANSGRRRDKYWVKAKEKGKGQRGFHMATVL